MKIGVFDSGVGGKSVVLAIQKQLPDVEVIYETDRENIPYGGKTPARLKELAIPKIKKLEEAGCQLVVVACNTVTTTIIDEVRASLSIPVVAIEPMIKPACAITKSKKIVVCATPATLQSSRYRELIKTYGGGVEVFEPNCSEWAQLIEQNQHNIENLKADIIEPLQAGADVIVLACTHYHWIEEEINHIAKEFQATVIQPEEAIISRLRTVISQLR